MNQESKIHPLSCCCHLWRKAYVPEALEFEMINHSTKEQQKPPNRILDFLQDKNVSSLWNQKEKDFFEPLCLKWTNSQCPMLTIADWTKLFWWILGFYYSRQEVAANDQQKQALPKEIWSMIAEFSEETEFLHLQKMTLFNVERNRFELLLPSFLLPDFYWCFRYLRKPATLFMDQLTYLLKRGVQTRVCLQNADSGNVVEWFREMTCKRVHSDVLMIMIEDYHIFEPFINSNKDNNLFSFEELRNRFKIYGYESLLNHLLRAYLR